MTFRVAKTIDGRILVEEESTNFVASFIDARWVFANSFAAEDELLEVDDPVEAKSLYKSAKDAAIKNDRNASAKAFYRAMYAGANPDPDDFGTASGGGNPDTFEPPDFPDQPDPSGVPRRPTPSTGGVSVELDLAEKIQDDG